MIAEAQRKIEQDKAKDELFENSVKKLYNAYIEFLEALTQEKVSKEEKGKIWTDISKMAKNLKDTYEYFGKDYFCNFEDLCSKDKKTSFFM